MIEERIFQITYNEIIWVQFIDSVIEFVIKKIVFFFFKTFL